MVFSPPKLRSDLPLYPPLIQLVRIGATTVPGPSGYGSSSFLGPVLYVGSTQQLRTDTILPRDREPCLVIDVNGFGLPPGYYIGRLAGSYNSLPVYEATGSAGGVLALPGLTPAQVAAIMTNLSPAQIAVLLNLNPCQLQTFLSLSVSQWQILTGSLTQTQLSILVGFLTSTQLQTLVTSLNVVQLQLLTSIYDPTQIVKLLQVFTGTQISTLLTGLTTAQLLELVKYDPAYMLLIFTQLTTAQLKTLLNLGSGAPLEVPFGSSVTVPKSLLGTLTGLLYSPDGTATKQVPIGDSSARLDAAGATVIASGGAAVSFGASATFDIGGYYSAGNPTRLTVATAGKYRLDAQGTWIAIGLPVRLWFKKNGTTDLGFVNFIDAPAASSLTQPIYWDGTLAAGDYIELMAYQNSGTPKAINDAAFSLRLWGREANS